MVTPAPTGPCQQKQPATRDLIDNAPKNPPLFTMRTSVPEVYKDVSSRFRQSLCDQRPIEPSKMEAELQSQIPGLDHIISEYSVVRISAHMRGGGL